MESTYLIKEYDSLSFFYSLLLSHFLFYTKHSKQDIEVAINIGWEERGEKPTPMIMGTWTMQCGILNVIPKRTNRGGAKQEQAKMSVSAVLGSHLLPVGVAVKNPSAMMSFGVTNSAPWRGSTTGNGGGGGGGLVIECSSPTQHLQIWRFEVCFLFVSFKLIFTF